MDFIKHLKRQLGFLERSCQGYDAGFLDESVRIATVLRVLFHSTSKQTPLLAHLDAINIRLVSAVRPIAPTTVAFDGMGITRMKIMNGISTASVVPNLGPYQTRHLLPVSDWWSQVVWMPGPGKRIRSDNMLGAANKDGGAHVDKRLSPEYEALAAEGALGTLAVRDSIGEMREPLPHAHLAYLRQIGQEVLISDELRVLATQGRCSRNAAF